MLNILIIDEKLITRKCVEEFFEDNEKDLYNVTEMSSDMNSVIEYLKTSHTDLVLVDVYTTGGGVFSAGTG